MLRQEAELGGHLPLELAKVRWDMADSLRQRPPGQLCRRSDVGRLCRLLSPDSLNPHPLTALRFENSLLSLISERPLQQLSSCFRRDACGIDLPGGVLRRCLHPSRVQFVGGWSLSTSGAPIVFIPGPGASQQLSLYVRGHRSLP